MSSPKVYIIIINYKRWQDTQACLAAILKSSYRNFSVLVVDNDSGNQSLEQLAGWLSQEMKDCPYLLCKKQELQGLFQSASLPVVTLVQNDHNAGFGKANNLVLDHIKGRDAYAWLLNPDMVPEENAMEELLNCATGQPQETIIGASIKKWEGNRDLFFYGGGVVNFYTATIHLCRQPAANPALDYISGGCLFTHAGNFTRNGLLEEKYFLYWEETDWCYRAKLQGAKLLVCPSAVCYDKISTVIGKGFLSDYYYARNGLYFVSTYRRRNIPFALLLISLRLLKKIFTGRWDRAGGIWKGTIDYLKGKQYERQ